MTVAEQVNAKKATMKGAAALALLSGVDGRERWACRTRRSTLGRGRITVRPLYHFPVLRDLVVDMAPFTARMRAVGAAFAPSDGERRYARIGSGSGERQDIDAAIECI